MTATPDLDTRRERDRAGLLDQITTYPDHEIPCRAVDLHVSAAWTSDEDDEQRVAAAACRSMPCPALAACRAYGLAWPRELGAYGGMTERERRKAAREGNAA